VLKKKSNNSDGKVGLVLDLEMGESAAPHYQSTSQKQERLASIKKATRQMQKHLKQMN
jgi:hypothetical protein